MAVSMPLELPKMTTVPTTGRTTMASALRILRTLAFDYIRNAPEEVITPVRTQS